MSVGAVLAIERSASVCTVVEVVLLVLLPGVGSLVPSEVTEAVFESTLPSATEEATVTCTVKLWLEPAARPVDVQVTL